MSFTDNTTGKYEWGTPQRFFDELNREFGFTLDVCATKENAKCQRYFDKKAKDGYDFMVPGMVQSFLQR